VVLTEEGVFGLEGMKDSDTRAVRYRRLFPGIQAV